MNDTLFQAASLIVPLIIAIVFHEVAHGWTARALGDPTAAEMNRLSLNPLRHVDPIGTVVLPGMLALMKAPILGWAKPVPVNRWRLRNPRWGMMIVAFAGPASNLIMAFAASVVIGFIVRSHGGQQPDGTMLFVFHNLANFLTINLFLALFNLLPLPPLDGSHIVEALLPRDLAASWRRLGRHGMLIIITLFIVLPSLVDGFDPVGAVIDKPFAMAMQAYGGVITALAGT